MTQLGMIHHRFERGPYVLFASRILNPGAAMSGINLFSVYRKDDQRQVIPVAHCVRAPVLREVCKQVSGASSDHTLNGSN